MKKTRIILLIAFTFLQLSCTKTKDSDEIFDSIEGTWQIQSLKLSSKYDFNGDGTATNDLITETNCLEDITYTFNNDGSGTYNSSQSLDIELLVDSNTNTLRYVIDCSTDENFSETITWAEKNNSITVEIDGDELKGTITDGLMTLKYNDSYIVEIFDGTTINEVAESVTLILAKQ